MEIIPNYLELNKFLKLKQIIFSSFFPFYYNSKTVGDESEKEKNDFFFCHTLFNDNEQKSNFFNCLVMPFLNNLNVNYLLRAKINCYTKKDKFIYTKFHKDFEQKHMVALFSFNTCNGFTYFKDTNEKISSVENQMIIFDGQKEHCSVSQTDTDLRINLNINFT